MKKDKLLAILIFFIFSVVLFRGYFFQNKVPFPANLLVSYYSPWIYYEWKGYPNGPPNKPIGFDNLRIFYPYKKFTIEEIKNLQWPLWNPYNFSGNVHLATYQSAVFYPLNFFYFVFSLVDSWSILVFLQPVLSGFFTYLFLKEINLSSRASFFGAFLFAFSGRMISSFEEVLVIEHSFLWLPLILYAIEKLIKKIQAGTIFLLFFSLICSILAGFLQSTIYVFITAFLWLIFRFGRNLKTNLSKIFFISSIGFLTLLIASPQILPAAQAYFFSPRGVVDISGVFRQYLMPPWHLVTFLTPDFWGNPGTYNYLGDGFYQEKVIYLGIPAAFFFLYAYSLREKNKFLTFFKVFSLLTLSLGFVPLGWLLYFSHLPLLSVMIPARIFFLSTFGLSVVAAFGVEFYLENKSDFKIWIKILALNALILFILWLVALCWKITLHWEGFSNVPFRNLILPTGFFAFSAFLILLPWLISKKTSFNLSFLQLKLISFFGLIIVSFLSSLYFANKYLYFSERRFVFPEVPLITKLKEISGIDRIWGYGNGNFLRNFNSYYGLFSPDGYDALFSLRYGELLRTQMTEGKITSQISRTDADIKEASERENVFDNWYRQRLLSLLGVRYIIESKTGDGKDWNTDKNRFPENSFQQIWEDEKFKIWEYKEALPRVFMVHDFLIEPDPQKIVNHLFERNFDLRGKIILEEEPRIRPNNQGVFAKDKIDLVKYSPNKIELNTDSFESSLLFLSDNYYSGWKALIDGKEEKILRSDYSFRAVPLPSGKHNVIFSYEPKIFFLSLKISIFSLFCLFLLVIYAKIKFAKIQK